MLNSDLLNNIVRYKLLLKVVYDVDDTIWQLTKIVCNILELQYDNFVSYDINKNPYFTKEEKRKIYECYSNPEVFKKCIFNDGYDRIFDLEQNKKAEVWISSANKNEEVMNLKLDRLLKEIPNINSEHISLTVKDTPFQGCIPGDILVDDSVYNIRTSNFNYNILIDMPYNRNISFLNKNVIRVYSLNEAIEQVEKIILNYDN